MIETDLVAFAEDSSCRQEALAVPGATFFSAPHLFYDAFSADECRSIRQLGRQAPQVAAGLVLPIEDYRVGEAAHIRLVPNTRWLYERIGTLFVAANRWYRFALTGMREPLLYCEYAIGGQFGWHIDCGDGATGGRKISISVQLSDENEYAGGGLEFAVHGELQESRGQGTSMAFPAFMPHRVERVTFGVRCALVAWAYGPAFR